MIVNEKQYRITRKKASDFAKAIEQLDQADAKRIGTQPRLIAAEREAMVSLMQDLRAELNEYELLKSTELVEITGTTFENLADGLVKARIASGLNQKELAQRMNIEEQQVQCYEAERYESASYATLCDVASELGVRIKNKVVLPRSANNFTQLLSKLNQVGLSREFVVNRLLSTADATRAQGEIPSNHNDKRLIIDAVAVLERVFGWSRDALLGAKTLPANLEVPPFTTYAKYLAEVVSRAKTAFATDKFPSDAKWMREIIQSENEGRDDLRAMLITAWNLGVSVLPLRGKGSFGAGCWRIQGRDVIVLKPALNDEEHWMMDLLRNLFYFALNPKPHPVEHIDDALSYATEREWEVERAACRFAGEVMLDGKAEQLYWECVHASKGDPRRLAKSIQQVAVANDVEYQRLSKYLSYRRRTPKFNWLENGEENYHHQPGDGSTIARDVFIEQFSFDFKDDLDRVVLDRALNG